MKYITLLHNKIQYIIRITNFKKHVLNLIVTATILFIVLYMCITIPAVNTITNFTLRIESNMSKNTEADLIKAFDFCKVNTCSRIAFVSSHVQDYHDYAFFKKVFLFYIDPLEIKIKSGKYLIVYDLVNYQEGVTNILIYSFTVIITLLLCLKILIALYTYKYTEMKELCKNNIMYNLRNELSESLHHECVLPLSTIRSQIRELSRKYSDITNLNNIFLAINMLDGTLGMLESNKRIKYNRISTIYDIINNTIKLYNNFQINKITYNIKDIDILTKMITNKYLESSILSNILIVLINNAIEANATHLEIRGNSKGNMLELYVKDDGCGIPSTNKNKIFQYGYSSKEKLNTKNRILDYIISLFDFSYTSGSYGTRGTGLSVVKNILLSVNGNIIVDESSEQGTTFKLDLPVSEIIYK